MNSRSKDAEPGRRALAIGIWENDGGAPAIDSDDHDYGQRVEADRSWTVYHVFSGVPARVDGVTMTGLKRSDATDSMLSLNHCTVVHRQERNALLRSSSSSAEVVSSADAAVQSARPSLASTAEILKREREWANFVVGVMPSPEALPRLTPRRRSARCSGAWRRRLRIGETRPECSELRRRAAPALQRR